jgi:hypothetical protein
LDVAEFLRDFGVMICGVILTGAIYGLFVKPMKKPGKERFEE